MKLLVVYFLYLVTSALLKVKDALEHSTNVQRTLYYSCTISLTSALDGGGWLAPHPGRFTPRKDPVPSVQEARWVPEPA
jgi:hypothetical protein